MNKNNLTLPSLAVIAVSICISFASYSLLKKDPDFNKLGVLFSFFSGLTSSIIGGYIAYMASSIQIRANKISEIRKESKRELTICLILKQDFQLIITRLELLTKNQITHQEIEDYISIKSLELFKNEALYLLNENKLNDFLSILNRLQLLKLPEKSKPVDMIVLRNLLEDSKKSILDIGILIESIKVNLKDNLDE